MPRLLEISCRNYQVTQSVLQLARELTQNRSQRLNFDVMVPNGVLLFRLISKTLVTFGKLHFSFKLGFSDFFYIFQSYVSSLILDMHHRNVFHGHNSWLVASDVLIYFTSLQTNQLLGSWCNVRRHCNGAYHELRNFKAGVYFRAKRTKLFNIFVTSLVDLKKKQFQWSKLT